MTLDAILSSASTSRAELDSTATSYRSMGAVMEMVVVYHFGVEDLATAIESLAVQLAKIGSAIEPYTEDFQDDRGDLTRAISAIIKPATPSAVDLVDTLINPDLTGTLSKRDERPYGHGDLRLVSYLAVDFETVSKTFRRYLVHTPLDSGGGA